MAQISTRYWGFKNETEGADPAQLIVTLVPLLDMANHAESESQFDLDEFDAPPDSYASSLWMA